MPIHCLGRFGRDAGGSTAVVFALALLPMLAAAGAALDYSRASQARTRLQSAVDGAVITGLKAVGVDRAAAAEAALRATFASDGATIQQASFTATANGGLRGRARAQVRSIFGKFLGFDGIDVSALSEGLLKSAPSAQPGNVCLMLMDPSAAETLRVNSGVSVAAPNCEVHVQTTANVGAVFSGNSTFAVKRVCLRGAGYIANGQPKLGPVETGCRTAADPFAGQLPAPPNLACTASNQVFKPGATGSTTVSPGTYCGDTRFKGNQDIVFQPGLYVIKDGAMTVGGGSRISGNGVTFYFANANSSLQLNGSVATQLAAPTSGPYAGVLMFEPGGLQRSSMALNGAQGHNASGLIYLPSRNVTFNGASSVASESLTMVFNALTLNGASDWRFDTSARTVPAPPPPAGSAVPEIVLRY